MYVLGDGMMVKKKVIVKRVDSGLHIFGYRRGSN
jgi:hypothetical protein